MTETKWLVVRYNHPECGCTTQMRSFGIGVGGNKRSGLPEPPKLQCGICHCDLHASNITVVTEGAPMPDRPRIEKARIQFIDADPPFAVAETVDDQVLLVGPGSEMLVSVDDDGVWFEVSAQHG